jgi:hypothetical protein
LDAMYFLELPEQIFGIVPWIFDGLGCAFMIAGDDKDG